MLFLYLTAHESSDLSHTNTGLGNVLFQLAAQYSICKNNNIVANYYFLEQFIKKLETFGLKNYDNTIFRNLININNDSNYDIILKENKGAHIYDNNLITNIISLKNKNILIKNSYLQSYKYFDIYANEIQDLFSPDTKSINEIYIKYPHLNEYDTHNISIHIRLNWNKDHLTYDDTFIKNAIFYLYNTKIIKNNENIYFYVFSDNIEKAKYILKKLNLNFIYCENNSDYIDLWTMSLCKYNIICHSTIGMWGAYLNKNKDKIIMYPSDIIDFYSRITGVNKDLIKYNHIPNNWVCLNSKSLRYNL
jgi:hypothetical protein